MKKITVTAICLIAAMLFSGCTTAKSLVKETTTKQDGFIIPIDTGDDADKFKDSAIHTSDYSFSKGQYFYFFYQYLTSMLNSYTEEELKKMGLNPEVSLKEQYAKDGVTWYDFMRNLTVEYMESILAVCEKADDEGITLDANDRAYLDAVKSALKAEAAANSMAFNDYIVKVYGGNVTAADYTDAITMEYIYNKYTQQIRDKLYSEITDEAAKEYADKSEGETKTRCFVYVEIDDGKAQHLLDAFSGSGKTPEELISLATAADYSYGRIVNSKKGSLEVSEIDNWLYEAGRSAGDIASVLTSDKTVFVVFCYAEGCATYIEEARSEMADKQTEDFTTGCRAQYPATKNNEILDSLNA